jgi:DNA-binding LacI/PurR family transcriptional regulator
VGSGQGAESSADRWRGVVEAAGATGLAVSRIPAGDPGQTLDSLVAAGATAAFVEDPENGARLAEAAQLRELRVPDDLSLIVLGNSARSDPADVDFTEFRIPREEMGRQAVALLAAILQGRSAERQVLLRCDVVEGRTLGPVPDRDAGCVREGRRKTFNARERAN